MLLTTARTNLLLDLGGDTNITNPGDIDRAVQRAVADLSRFLPRDFVDERTVEKDVTDEAWTSAAAAGTYVTLANKPIDWDSETVKNDAGNTMVRDTDYTMNYMAGTITHISGGNIGNTESCTITYEKSQHTIDLGSTITDVLIRVTDVEYPVGKLPQEFVSFDPSRLPYLTITGRGYESQFNMTDGDHVRVYYKGLHTAPTASAVGTYPAFLDDSVLMAAEAYVLLMLAQKARMLAYTYTTDADTALDKVIVYLTNNSSEDSKYWLTKLTTDDADLKAKINTALDAVATQLGNVFTTDLEKATVGAAAMLEAGDDYIPTTNVGKDVPENYQAYSLARAAHADARIGAALGYIQEATTRLANFTGYINRAGAWKGIADGFLMEAAQRKAAAEAALAVAAQYQNEAIERRNEAWAIWRDPLQYIGSYTRSSVSQPAVGT